MKTKKPRPPKKVKLEDPRLAELRPILIQAIEDTQQILNRLRAWHGPIDAMEEDDFSDLPDKTREIYDEIDSAMDYFGSVMETLAAVLKEIGKTPPGPPMNPD